MTSHEVLSHDVEFVGTDNAALTKASKSKSSTFIGALEKIRHKENIRHVNRLASHDCKKERGKHHKLQKSARDLGVFEPQVALM